MRVLRLLADEGTEWPLWNEQGPVPDMHSLGLSESLIRDIRRWFYSCTHTGEEWPAGIGAQIQDEDELDAEALRLVDAIKAEVGAGYQVKYVP